MPGKPLPRAGSRSQIVRDEVTGRTFAGPTPGSQARQDQAERELTDRRLNARGEPAPLVHVGPDTPGKVVGRAWLRPRTTET